MEYQQEGHKYFVRVFARNEVGLSEALEMEEPVKVVRPPGKKINNFYFKINQTIDSYRHRYKHSLIQLSLNWFNYKDAVIFYCKQMSSASSFYN